MTDKATTDERRFDLETTLCDDGRHVNVRNQRSGSGDVHTVHLNESGTVERCTCPGYTYNSTCYHVDTVRANPLLVASARATVATHQPVATDGGRDTSEDTCDESDETDTLTCNDCGESFEDFLAFARHDRGDSCDESFMNPHTGRVQDKSNSTGIEEL